MSTARKVLDWHRQDGAELVRELNDLPEGQYELVPLTDEEEEEDFNLTPDQVRGLEEALARGARGEPGVPMDEYFARRAARRGARTP
jgi:hypothetical protein